MTQTTAEAEAIESARLARADRPADIPDNADADVAERSIGIKISIIARLLRQRFDERVEAMGVTRAKYMLVATVGRNPGATQRMIAQKLEVTDVTAGRLIDRVCADGLLERREHPDDRRAYCVYLTPAAQPILKELAAAAQQYERETFAGFDVTELEMLDSLLVKLAANLGTRADGTGRPVSFPKLRQRTG